MTNKNINMNATQETLDANEFDKVFDDIAIKTIGILTKIDWLINIASTVEVGIGIGSVVSGAKKMQDGNYIGGAVKCGAGGMLTFKGGKRLVSRFINRKTRKDAMNVTMKVFSEGMDAACSSMGEFLQYVNLPVFNEYGVALADLMSKRGDEDFETQKAAFDEYWTTVFTNATSNDYDAEAVYERCSEMASVDPTFATQQIIIDIEQTEQAISHAQQAMADAMAAAEAAQQNL